MVSEKHAHALRLADSYGRLDVLFEIASDALALDEPLDEFWKLLGEEWCVCDNIAAHTEWLRELMCDAEREHLSLMMDEDERAQWDKLPEELTVYRGCYEFNREGLSWSLDPKIAATFPMLFRYQQPDQQALLLTMQVEKARTVLKLGRDEREVIVPELGRIVSATSIEAA